MGKNRKWFRNKFAVFPAGGQGKISLLFASLGI